MRSRVWYSALSLVFALCILSLFACTNHTPSSEAPSTKYIGDNSAVSRIAQNLPYPEGATYTYIKIQSSEEPYELFVFLTIDKNKKDVIQKQDFQACADEAFNKIENMGKISFLNSDDESTIAQFERK